jgi:hypothetical protein
MGMAIMNAVQTGKNQMEMGCQMVIFLGNSKWAGSGLKWVPMPMSKKSGSCCNMLAIVFWLPSHSNK